MIGLVLVAGGALGAYALSGGFQQPTVEQVDVRWGTVTEDTSTIRATIVVHNPNAVGIPGVATVGYEARLNDVTIASGAKSGVGLSPGRNELELAIPVENGQIPAWWVTHVEGGEQSTLTIEPTIRAPLGLSYPLPAQQQPFETDILGSFASDASTEVALFGEPFLVLGEQSATWGEPTDESTPVTFTAEVTNEHDRPLTFDGVGYVVTMNGITMGEGETRESFTVPPGETKTLEIRAALDTAKFDEWWVSHLEGDESTTMAVETYAVVEGGEEDPTVDISLVEMRLDLETDLLGGGGASTSDATTEVGGDLAFEAPTADVGQLAWGEVTDETTALEADLAVTNPNQDSALNELVDLTVRQRAAINDVQVANDTTHLEDLPAGDTSVTLTSHLDNAKVPQWWARHVNNGETSTVTVDSTATVDVGVTTLDLDLTGQERQFSTDMLANLNGDRDQTVTVQGRTAATLQSSSATWGQADARETPIDAGLTLRNERSRVALTVSDVAYTVTMNGVTVADGTDPATLTLQPGESGTLAFTMVLDSTKMTDWWVSHVEHGEETTLSVELTATVEVGGQTEQVTFDLATGDTTVETDILGGA